MPFRAVRQEVEEVIEICHPVGMSEANSQERDPQCEQQSCSAYWITAVNISLSADRGDEDGY